MDPYCRFNNARADITSNFASGRYYDGGDYWDSNKVQMLKITKHVI